MNKEKENQEGSERKSKMRRNKSTRTLLKNKKGVRKKNKRLQEG